MHFGTFQLTAEGIDDPLHALTQALDARAIPRSRFSIPGSGESVFVGHHGIARVGDRAATDTTHGIHSQE